MQRWRNSACKTAIMGQNCTCDYRSFAPDHHDRILRLEDQPLDSVAELIEVAVTWHELDYSESEPRVPPSSWIQFAAEHQWRDPDRIMDLMIGLASIARISGPAVVDLTGSVTEISEARSLRLT